MSTIEHLQALHRSLQAARNASLGPLVSKQYAAGINDGLDVALNMIALEIKLAEADAEAPHQ